MIKAQSNYQQVQVTITEERGNRLSVRVMVKPPHVDWKQTHVVWRHSWVGVAPSSHWFNLLSLAFQEIAGETLPEG